MGAEGVQECDHFQIYWNPKTFTVIVGVIWRSRSGEDPGELRHFWHAKFYVSSYVQKQSSSLKVNRFSKTD
ncbi:hypothetical protein Csa_007248 [Cucumis sativus]|uniref:Uncharacterized protein n=1 Tax=Cucumis sativus TaxID=3659 RepID=A0A0A0M0A9_CUCSA|nr:hypothetical protein Csa_007248 [Cucumis sativus]